MVRAVIPCESVRCGVTARMDIIHKVKSKVFMNYKHEGLNADVRENNCE
jgi:hypothetical protein